MHKRLIMMVLGCSITALFAASCSQDETTGPEGISMTEAIEIVTNDILPAEVPQGVSYVCIKMSGSIPEGSTIVEDAPGAGQAPPLDEHGAGQTRTSMVPAAAFAVSEESYFFYLDLAPQSFYEHPVKYIVVGKESGDYGVTEAQWWPKINGQTPTQFLAAVPAAAHIVATNVDLVTPTGLVKQYSIPIIQLAFAEGFIVVQGLMSNEALFSDASTTYLNGIHFFTAYKNAAATVEGLVQGQAADVLNVIDAMVDDGKCLITIYIIAHGRVDGVRLGGVWITATDFYNKMNEYPNVLFNFLLGSCHSGSFIDNLETLDNVRVILTACTTAQGAKPDWDEKDTTTDYNTDDSGSEWTSSLLAGMELVTANSLYWSTIVVNAGIHGVPVTCELLCAAGYGCVGANPGLGMSLDLDLSHRTGWTTPQGYCSWEFPN